MRKIIAMKKINVISAPLTLLCIALTFGDMSMAHAQNAIQGAGTLREAQTSLSSGSTSTESVLKDTLPLQKMQPGTPSVSRVAEPQVYVDLQKKIDALKQQSLSCLEQYHLAKSQAWLNFSRDQYHEKAWQKDIQKTTLGEAARLVDALERKQDPGMQTPLVSQAAKLRADLWETAERIKRNQDNNLCCATLETAYCEVQLVWSGHALANLGGYKRANGHVRMAEDLCQEAEKKVCTTAPVPEPIVPTPERVPAAKVVELKLEAIALFRHDRFDKSNLLPDSVVQLKAFANRVKNIKVTHLDLTGFADQTNSTGDAQYNVKLANKRAATVQSYLKELGVDLSHAEMSGKSDSAPVKTDCPIPKGSNGVVFTRARKADILAYNDCLQPNRRVEVRAAGITMPK
jgi:OmpA-OmpF porin, OOP family